MKPLATFVSGVAAAFFLLSSPVWARVVKVAPAIKPDLTTIVVKSSHELSSEFERETMASGKKTETPSASGVKLPNYTGLQDRTKRPIPPEYMAQLMQVAAVLNKPLDEFLATSYYESAGTFNPYIKPIIAPAEGKKPPRYGQATGLFQFQDDTFNRVMNKNAKAILNQTKGMDLGDGVFTDAQVRRLLENHNGRATPELLALRSNVIVSAFAKHYLDQDSGGQTPAARYSAHVTGTTRPYDLGAHPDFKNKPAAPDFGVIATSNPGIFGPSDKPRTYGEVRQILEGIMSVGGRLARESLGVGYDERPTAAQKSGADLKREMTSFFATSGEEVRLPKSFVYQGLSKEEQATYRERFAHEALRGGYNKGQDKLNPEETTWLIASLKRQGVLAQDSAARDFSDPRLKQALAAFQEKVGMAVPPESRGLLMPAAKVALGIYNERIDMLAGRQLEQQRGLKAPGVSDLRKLAKLEKDDPERKAAEPQILALKEALGAKGLLARPSHVETHVSTGKKGRQIKRKVRVEDDFDAQIDHRLIAAYETAQVKNGLLPNGKLDQVSLQVIKGQPVVPTSKPVVATTPPLPSSPAAAMAVVARPAPTPAPAPAADRTPAPAPPAPVRTPAPLPTRPAATTSRPSRKSPEDKAGPVKKFNPASRHAEAEEVSVSLAALQAALEAPSLVHRPEPPSGVEPVVEAGHATTTRPAERSEPS